MKPGIWTFSAVVLLTACGGRAPKPAKTEVAVNSPASQLQSIFRKPEMPVPGNGLFVDASAETGLRFSHFIGATGHRYMPEIVGAGAAVLDYDRDGDLDVLLIQGDYIVPPRPGESAVFPFPAGQMPGSRLFRNEVIPSGKLRFSDVTESAGIRSKGYGMGVAAGDIDNDGDLDLYLTNYGPNQLYRNEGNGRFTDITAASGTEDSLWSSSGIFVDYDRDGWLDLFFTDYVDFSPANHKNCQGPRGESDYCGPQVYNGLPARLFRNLHNGRFQDVSQSSGIGANPAPGLGVTVFDANRDEWPDIYVANDGKPNHLWLNTKDGKFVESALELGLALADSGIPRAGMGVAMEDSNGDGKPEMIVTNLTNEGATLFRADGPAGFFDISTRQGLDKRTLSSTGFGVGWFDALNRGLLDIYIANGEVRLVGNRNDSPYPYGQKNLLLLRNPKGGFDDARASGGPAMELNEVSRAAAFGDLDNDGDIDIVVTNNNGPARLLLNQLGNRRHWLQVKVDGGPSNRFGFASRLELRRTGKPALWRTVHCGYGYLSFSEPRVHFGLDDWTGPVTLVAHWTDGTAESRSLDGVDRIVEFKRSAPPAKRVSAPPDR